MNNQASRTSSSVVVWFSLGWINCMHVLLTSDVHPSQCSWHMLTNNRLWMCGARMPAGSKTGLFVALQCVILKGCCCDPLALVLFFPPLPQLTYLWPIFSRHARYWKSLIIGGRHTKRINIPASPTLRRCPSPSRFSLFGLSNSVFLLHSLTLFAHFQSFCLLLKSVAPLIILLTVLSNMKNMKFFHLPSYLFCCKCKSSGGLV